MLKEDRYHRDPKFQRLVDTLYHVILENEMTPTEIREAAVLAQIKYEMSHPRPILFPGELGNIKG